MLLSMTGFGHASGSFDNKKLTLEIKSLNGKTSDLRLKLPTYYKEKEIELRNLILKNAHRGKLEATLSIDSESGHDEFGLNKPLFKKYYRELKEMQSELGSNQGDLVQGILRIQNVVKPIDTELAEEEWNVVMQLATDAVNKLNTFRIREAQAMEMDLRNNILSISEKLDAVEPFEKQRIENLKARMKRHLDEFVGAQNVDLNRFEQEVLYYMEKLDINEEKVRLSQHCKFFIEVIGNADALKGKKLGFIAQEMGREINTLGAKAQDSNIQQFVVGMKDELEKIKEQLANIV